jgi:peptidoglycan hydrolase-like protein with peptidoglycan-binding domain
MKMTWILLLALSMLLATSTIGLSIDNEIYQLQTELEVLGYDVGGIDGVLGEKTINAIKRFQRDYGLSITGNPDEYTRTYLQEIADQRRAKRGIQIEKVIGEMGYGRKRALVIGINSYSSIPLEAAVADAEAVSARLSELNFKVTTLC